MAITIVREGFSQVEPNLMNFMRDGSVRAQLPAAEDIEVLEQGTFVKYDGVAGEVNFTGNGPWFMVYNEEKLYDERKQMHKDYAMQRAEIGGEMVPRVVGLSAGDILTTNAVVEEEYEVGDLVAPNAEGVLDKVEESAVEGLSLVFQVIKETTMPDMQPAVKLECIKAL